jgi:hypothetical protein
MVIHMYPSGRLGNQLFQYWVGKYLSSQLHQPVFYFENDFDYRMIGEPTWITDVFLPKNRRPSNISKESVNSLEDLQEILKNPKPDYYFFDSYCESALMVKKHEDFIRDLYTPEKPWGFNSRIAVYIRLGDLRNKYLKSFNDFLRFVEDAVKSHPHLPPYIVSSDPKDPMVLKLIERNPGMTAISGQVHDDFRFLAESEVTISVNSTFSWWASWFNESGTHYVHLHPETDNIRDSEKLYGKGRPENWRVYHESKGWI